ncbi:MAG TPA: hypothetical protein VFE24_10170 [Pirellulales bacterium]|nr:hypothetical protein [Pirellulales bacterium]
MRVESDSSLSTIYASKVPAVTLVFWVIKICATTLGETGGDALSMTLNLGYLVSTLIFFAFFAVAVTAQIRTDRFRPFVYWTVVVATTTVGTTLSDFLDRSAGLGYLYSSLVELAGVMGMLLLWRFWTGRIVFENITRRTDEFFYWATILVSNTLGTALGDFVADDSGLGFVGGALLFAGLLASIAAVHYFRAMPPAILFWAAYVLTRPLGATLGDTLTKPLEEGGLNLSRVASSGVIGVAMIALILFCYYPRSPRSVAWESPADA